jgi:Fe-S-cluster containining protein
MTRIKVNLAAMQQPFHPCTPDFIRDVCQARCCRSTTDPTGIAVVVTPAEAIQLRKHGAHIDDSTGRVAPVNRRCPFQSVTTHACKLHDTPDKPKGCIISPFTINNSNTLIVRNRYRRLPCFKADGAIPVYQAHHQSLITMFGETQAEYLAHFASSPQHQTDTVHLDMDYDLAVTLKHKNRASKS